MTSIGIAFFGADEYPVETRPVRKLRALADQIDPPLACENCGTTDEPLVDADPVPTLCADCDTEAHERAEEDAEDRSAAAASEAPAHA